MAQQMISLNNALSTIEILEKDVSEFKTTV
jgi:hypothetical protein